MSSLRSALEAGSRRDMARRHLADFISLLEPTYERARHTVTLCEHLEAVESGKIDRLMVMMPPRHGKTMHVSQAYPAWVFGRNPRSQIILASYGAELAEGNSRKARAFMRDERWPFECKVSDESRAQNRWQTDKGGILIATGCEGGLTGHGADRLIIDDPIRDRSDAESDTIRERLWLWYSDVARTRLMPNGRIILCQTRWHDDDLAGRILNSDDANRWTVLSLAAVNDDGTALWPERFPVDSLPSVERGEISSSSFASLYMQDPVPAGGALFKTAWLEWRYDKLPDCRIDNKRLLIEHPNQTADILRQSYGIQPRELRPLVVQAADSAWKDGPQNDRSAIATIVSDGINYYIADVFADRLEYTALRRNVVAQYEKHHPSRLFVEEAASGYALVAELKRARASRSSVLIPVATVKLREPKWCQVSLKVAACYGPRARHGLAMRSMNSPVSPTANTTTLSMLSCSESRKRNASFVYKLTGNASIQRYLNGGAPLDAPILRFTLSAQPEYGSR
jgi:hypothetical protein